MSVALYKGDRVLRERISAALKVLEPMHERSQYGEVRKAINLLRYGVETILNDAELEAFVLNGTHTCPRCKEKMAREVNPTGGDSWWFVCPNSHALWVGK